MSSPLLFEIRGFAILKYPPDKQTISSSYSNESQTAFYSLHYDPADIRIANEIATILDKHGHKASSDWNPPTVHIAVVSDKTSREQAIAWANEYGGTLIAVIAESSDDVRRWAEQVAPLTSNPLLIAVSAARDLPSRFAPFV